MDHAPAAASATAQWALVRKLTRRVAAVVSFGPAVAGLAVGRLDDYPREGLTTLVTQGLALLRPSLWRGLPLGRELVATTTDEPSRVDELAELLRSVLLAELERARSGDRRRIVEANGVWAPGYPPHVVFTSAASLTPALLVQKKVGDRYVEFWSALPLGDAELREYERGPGRFVDALAASGDLLWPRGTVTPPALRLGLPSAQPEAAARFWAALLGGRPDRARDGSWLLQAPGGTTLHLVPLAPGALPPTSSLPGELTVDVDSADRAVAAALAAGGRSVPGGPYPDEPRHGAVALLDPDGRVVVIQRR